MQINGNKNNAFSVLKKFRALNKHNTTTDSDYEICGINFSNILSNKVTVTYLYNMDFIKNFLMKRKRKN